MLVGLFAGDAVDILRAGGVEPRPVYGAGLKIVNGEAGDGLGLVGDGILGVFAPAVGGGDYDAGGEERVAEGGEKGVDIAFGDGVLWLIELALDTAELAGGAFFGDDIDPDIADFSFAGPVVEEPDGGEALGIDGIECEVAADQAFEAVAKIVVGAGFPAEIGEYVV